MAGSVVHVGQNHAGGGEEDVGVFGVGGVLGGWVVSKSSLALD